MPRIIAAVFVIVTTLVGSNQLRADPVVIVEGWNQRPDTEAQAILGRLRLQFSAEGAAVYERDGITPKEAEELVEQGRKAYVNGEGKEALRILDDVIRRLREPPAKLSDSEELRRHLLKALVAAAQASSKLGDRAAASEYMEMVERGFPNDPIPTKWFGTGPIKLRRKVARRLARKRPVALNLSVSPPFASVYVDGQRVGASRQLRLTPGQYLVFAASGEVVGATEEVNLSNTDGGADLFVPQMLGLAGMLAARGVGDVVLISLWDNRVVKGVRYRNGDVVRAARISTAADAGEIREFAARLMKPNGRDELIGRGGVVKRTHSRGAESRGRPDSIREPLAVIAMSVGLASFATGGVIALAGSATTDDDLMAGGVVMGVAGAVLFGTGAALYWVF